MEFGRRSYGRPKLEANNKKNDNCVPLGNFLLHTKACCSTFNEFLSLKGSEFGYTYFQEICSNLPKNLNHSIRMRDDQVMVKTQSLFEREN